MKNDLVINLALMCDDTHGCFTLLYGLFTKLGDILKVNIRPVKKDGDGGLSRSYKYLTEKIINLGDYTLVVYDLDPRVPKEFQNTLTWKDMIRDIKDKDLCKKLLTEGVKYKELKKKIIFVPVFICYESIMSIIIASLMIKHGHIYDDGKVGLKTLDEIINSTDNPATIINVPEVILNTNIIKNPIQKIYTETYIKMLTEFIECEVYDNCNDKSLTQKFEDMFNSYKDNKREKLKSSSNLSINEIDNKINKINLEDFVKDSIVKKEGNLISLLDLLNINILEEIWYIYKYMGTEFNILYNKIFEILSVRTQEELIKFFNQYNFFMETTMNYNIMPQDTFIGKMKRYRTNSVQGAAVAESSIMSLLQLTHFASKFMRLNHPPIDGKHITYYISTSDNMYGYDMDNPNKVDKLTNNDIVVDKNNIFNINPLNF